jgi:hypothetical protein
MPAEEVTQWPATDRESRLRLTCRTANGTYDQVLGLSEDIINYNFDKLWEINEKLQKFYDSVNGVGSIQMELDAPRIMIPSGSIGQNFQNVWFQVRAKSGWIKGADGTVLVEDMKDWIVTTDVKLDSLAADDSPIDPKMPKEKAEKIRKKRERLQTWISQEFSLPGDYRIERIYAKLSSAKWGNPDYKLSQAGFYDTERKSPRSLEEYMVDKDTSALLAFFFQRWAVEMEEEGHSTCGVSFSIEKKKDVKATYEPTSMVHQVSAYRTAKYPKGIQRTPMAAPEDQSIAGRNAFLFCEKVLFREPPQFAPLIWTGNFATQAEPPRPKVDGTFLLSHEVFLGMFILPELQILNQASEIWHDEPDFYVNKTGTGGSIRLNNPHNVGRYVNPYDEEAVKKAKEYYAFSPDVDPGDKYKVKSYYWTKTHSTAPLFETEVSTSGEKYFCHAFMEDVITTRVTWEPGTSVINVKGTVTMKEKAYWAWDASAEVKDPAKPRDHNNINYEKSATTVIDDVYNVEWNVKITIIKDEDNFNDPEKVKGTLSAIVEAGPSKDGNPTVLLKPTVHTNVIMNGHDDFVKQNVAAKLKQQIPIMIANIKAKLEGAGKFIFPGNGTLIFENPEFGYWGDLLAQVKFLPLEPGTLRIVPGEPDIQKNKTVESSKVTPDIRLQKFDLEWQITPKAPEKIYSRQMTKMITRAENKSAETYYYERLIVQFASGSKARDLFGADTFTKDPVPKKAGFLESTLSALRDKILGKKQKQKEIDAERLEIERRIQEISERRKAAEARKAAREAETAARLAAKKKIEDEQAEKTGSKTGDKTGETSKLEVQGEQTVIPGTEEKPSEQETLAGKDSTLDKKDEEQKVTTEKTGDASKDKEAPWAGNPIPPVEETDTSAEDLLAEQEEREREEELKREEAELADLADNEAALIQLEKDLENAKVDDIKQFTQATLNKSPNFPDADVKVNALPGGGVYENRFQAIITAKAGMLKVPAGAWVELSLEGFTNPARQCVVELFEDRKDKDGKSVTIYHEPRTIPINVPPRKK